MFAQYGKQYFRCCQLLNDCASESVMKKKIAISLKLLKRLQIFKSLNWSFSFLFPVTRRQRWSAGFIAYLPLGERPSRTLWQDNEMPQTWWCEFSTFLVLLYWFVFLRKINRMNGVIIKRNLRNYFKWFIKLPRILYCIWSQVTDFF